MIGPTKHRSSLLNILLGLPLAMLVWSCSPGFLKDDHIEVGTVLNKVVVSLAEGNTVQILSADADEITYLSDSVASHFEVKSGNLTLSEVGEAGLREDFVSLEYRVKVRLCIRKTTEEYTLDRKSFNALRIGVTAKFQLNAEESAIDSLIAY